MASSQALVHSTLPFFLSSVLAVVLLVFGAVPGQAQPLDHFTNCTLQTSNNATVIIPATATVMLGNEPIDVGDELAVFNAHGRCVGAVVWTGQNVAFSVWGRDAFTSAHAALEQDETMRFRGWDASADKELGSQGAFSITLSDRDAYLTSEPQYTPNAIYVVDSLRFNPEPQAAR